MILDKIVKKKREKLDIINLDLETLKIKAKDSPVRKSFYEVMAKPGLSIIGEVKKASPSKGIIVEDFDPIGIAKQYEKCVDAMSVLTEEDFFLGSPKYLEKISKETNIPLLRKDFIIDEVQIYEAKVIGASAVLLIAAILSKDTLQKYIELVHKLGMDALVEVHTKTELDMVLKTDAKIIGINNRDLKTFDVSLNTTVELSKYIPKDKLIIGESGINTAEDIIKLRDCIDGILVGESFMRSGDIIKKAKEFKEAYKK